MSDLLSTISGQFTKAFIFGAGIPAVIFVLVNVLLIMPALPPDFWLVQRLEPLDIEWRAVTAVFAAVVLGGLLSSLNIPLIRTYEGYTFNDSWLGARMRRSQQNELRTLEKKIEGLRQEQRAIMTERDSTTSPEDRSKAEERLAQVVSRLTRLWSDRRVRFPDNEEFVVPTRLGNVIAAFECYPRIQYRIDSVALWPHLVAVIEARYAAVIDDAKTSLDFFINSSFLCAVLAAECACVAIFSARLASVQSSIPRWLVGAGLLGLLSWLCYECSIDSALGWGVHVKAAFDLYRQDLLKKLGYQQPATPAQEVDLWRGISQGVIYNAPECPPPPCLAEPAAKVRVDAEPQEIQSELRITKGVDVASSTEEKALGRPALRYVVRVENAASQLAENATLVDAPPCGFEYVVGSSRVDRNGQCATLEPVGTNPYRWHLGKVEAGESIVVTYMVLALPERSTPGTVPQTHLSLR